MLIYVQLKGLGILGSQISARESFWVSLLVHGDDIDRSLIAVHF
jgi:hypothetical protein